MKKRYCINIDKCVGVPFIPSMGWLIFLLCLFFATLIGSLVNGISLVVFFASIVNSWALWLYLSCPFTFFVSFLVSICFIFFPVSFVEIGDESMRIHRAFKKDRIIRYEEVFYVRFNKARRRNWVLLLFLSLGSAEINTIEVRKKYPLPSFWLSSSPRLYLAIKDIILKKNYEKEKIVEGDYYVAKAQWVAEHGNPQDSEWGYNGIR